MRQIFAEGTRALRVKIVVDRMRRLPFELGRPDSGSLICDFGMGWVRWQ